MTELVSKTERTAFWGEAGGALKDGLKGKSILVMSSGTQDARIGEEAYTFLKKLGANVLVGGSNERFIFEDLTGVTAYLKAFDAVDAAVFIVPKFVEGSLPQDDGMVDAMKVVATTPIGYVEEKGALGGSERTAESIGVD